MRPINHSRIIFISIGMWLVGIINVFGQYHIIGNILVVLSTVGYMIGVFFWARSNQGEEAKVTFWKKTDTDIIGGFKGLMRFGIGFHLIFFMAIIIWSNWWTPILETDSSNNQPSRCETYECRRKNMMVYLETDKPIVQEPNKLIVERKEFYLPKFRVFIGDYNSEFELPENEELQYFEGTDSVATMNLIFESAGEKTVRGIIEEYKTISEDSIDSYRYPFEITVEVSEQLKEPEISI